jgi:hypothetical protein
MPGTIVPSSSQTHSPYGFLELDDEVLQGLIHFCREPEVGHSALDTAELWLHILDLGFPREERYYTKASQEPFSDKIDGSGGIIIEVWKIEGYLKPVTNLWVTTKNEPVFVLLCQSVSYAMTEFPATRLKHDTSMEINTFLQRGLRDRCAQLVNQIPGGKGTSAGIACGSGARFFKWKVNDPDKYLCLVNGFVDLGSGNVPASARVIELVIERVKDPGRKGKVGSVR